MAAADAAAVAIFRALTVQHARERRATVRAAVDMLVALPARRRLPAPAAAERAPPHGGLLETLLQDSRVRPALLRVLRESIAEASGRNPAPELAGEQFDRRNFGELGGPVPGAWAVNDGGYAAEHASAADAASADEAYSAAASAAGASAASAARGTSSASSPSVVTLEDDDEFAAASDGELGHAASLTPTPPGRAHRRRLAAVALAKPPRAHPDLVRRAPVQVRRASSDRHRAKRRRRGSDAADAGGRRSPAPPRRRRLLAPIDDAGAGRRGDGSHRSTALRRRALAEVHSCESSDATHQDRPPRNARLSYSSCSSSSVSSSPRRSPRSGRDLEALELPARAAPTTAARAPPAAAASPAAGVSPAAATVASPAEAPAAAAAAACSRGGSATVAARAAPSPASRAAESPAPEPPV